MARSARACSKTPSPRWNPGGRDETREPEASARRRGWDRGAEGVERAAVLELARVRRSAMSLLPWIAVILAQASYYSPAEAQALFTQGNEAYYREDYAGAEATYRKLVERGLGGPDVEYNLGTACLAQGKLGEAVLHLERARKVAEQTQDIDANLALARSRQMDQVVGALAEDPFSTRIVAATSERGATWAFLVAWGVLWALVAFFRYLPLGARTWSVVVGVVALIVSIPAGMILGAHAYVRENIREGVVLAQTARARELPKADGKVAFEMHAGLKVRILDETATFVRVRLPNGLEGWAERDGVAEL
jgi:tetratricopeptide (TPR) repeat protein